MTILIQILENTTVFIFEQNMHADFAATRARGTRTASRRAGSTFRRKYFLLRGVLAACQSTTIVMYLYIRILL